MAYCEAHRAGVGGTWLSPSDKPHFQGRNDMTALIKNKLTRAEKNELTRANLFEAAVKVVGEIGYRDALVTDITSRANIALGTFYNYFDSRQDILDQLLPELGESLLEFLGQQVGGSTFLDREEKSIRAYFQFIKESPEFYRILTEAQVYAPQSFTRHVENLMLNYEASLKKTKENGFLTDYSPAEFEAISTILLGARVYLMRQFCFRKGKTRAIPEHVINTFMKVITFGLGGSAAASGKNRQKTPTQNSERMPEVLQREIVVASDSDLTIIFQTPMSLQGTSSAESDFLVQKLCSDLVKEVVDSILDGDARLQNTCIYMAQHRLPKTISGHGRVERMSASDGLIQVRLSSGESAESMCLASGHVSFC